MGFRNGEKKMYEYSSESDVEELEEREAARNAKDYNIPNVGGVVTVERTNTETMAKYKKDFIVIRGDIDDCELIKNDRIDGVKIEDLIN